MKSSKSSRGRGNDAIVGVDRPGDDQPFGKVYTAIIRDVTLPRNVKTIYTYLSTWCADQRSAFPGRELMAEETDLSVSAIDEAKRIGLEVKLWSIEKVPTKSGYSYNKYVLHDRDGVYVPGSGPGKRQKGKPRGRAAADDAQEPRPKSGPGHGQNLAPPRPKSGPYQDKGSIQARIETRDASGEDAPAGAHEQARERECAQQPTKPRKVRIVRPPDFVAFTDGEMTHELIASAAAATRQAGLPLGSYGKAELARRLMLVAHLPVDTRVQQLEEVLNAGLAGASDVAWLFTDKPKRPGRANTDDAIEDLHDELDGLPGATTCIDSMRDRYHPDAIANTVLKTAAVMA